MPIPAKGYTTPIEKRFWSKVQKTDGCWLWTAATQGKYGVLWDNDLGRHDGAHRVAYRLFKGPIGPNQLVRHKCDTPLCVNPDHLELGDHKDNSQDAVERGRVCRGARHHLSKLTPKDVRRIRKLIDQGRSVLSLADEYNVAESTIRRIKNRKTWKHV